MKYIKFIFLASFIVAASLFAENITFFVSSDPHYGYDMLENNEKTNKAAIDDMNNLPGKSYPGEMGGVVAIPEGVLVAGDLTSGGETSSWEGYWYLPWTAGFNDDYEVGGNGRLHFPVYEGYWNHDIHKEGKSPVLEGIKLRNKSRAAPIVTDDHGLHYSWDWEGIHFVNLNLYPGGPGLARNSLDFLRMDLSEFVAESGRPVIIMFHADLNSPDSWWSGGAKERFYEVIKNYNVVLIITGHTHISSFYHWKEIPVVNAISVRDGGRYYVVNIHDGVIRVVERNPKGWGTWVSFSYKQ